MTDFTIKTEAHGGKAIDKPLLTIGQTVDRLIYGMKSFLKIINKSKSALCINTMQKNLLKSQKTRIY